MTFFVWCMLTVGIQTCQLKYEEVTPVSWYLFSVSSCTKAWHFPNGSKESGETSLSTKLLPKVRNRLYRRLFTNPANSVALPKGTKIVSADSCCVSSWTKISKISAILQHGSRKKYFLKASIIQSANPSPAYKMPIHTDRHRNWCSCIGRRRVSISISHQCSRPRIRAECSWMGRIHKQ